MRHYSSILAKAKRPQRSLIRKQLMALKLWSIFCRPVIQPRPVPGHVLLLYLMLCVCQHRWSRHGRGYVLAGTRRGPVSNCQSSCSPNAHFRYCVFKPAIHFMTICIWRPNCQVVVPWNRGIEERKKENIRLLHNKTHGFKWIFLVTFVSGENEWRKHQN